MISKDPDVQSPHPILPMSGLVSTSLRRRTAIRSAILAHRLCPVDTMFFFGIIADGMQNKGQFEELQLHL